MPKKSKKKGKKQKEVTFGPTFQEQGINAVQCSLSKFMKVEKYDVVINLPDYSVTLRKDEEDQEGEDGFIHSGEETPPPPSSSPPSPSSQ